MSPRKKRVTNRRPRPTKKDQEDWDNSRRDVKFGNTFGEIIGEIDYGKGHRVRIYESGIKIEHFSNGGPVITGRATKAEIEQVWWGLSWFDIREGAKEIAWAKGKWVKLWWSED